MRTALARSWTLASVGAALALAVPRDLHAQQQLDVNPALPNVLLLVDNSGSMERMIDGTIPESNPANACNVSGCVTNGTSSSCTTWGPAPPANRWNTLVTALTGSMAGGGPPSCISVSRATGSPFVQEYSIGNVPPYDADYYLSFHRMVAQDTSKGTAVPCVMGPGYLPGATNGAGVGPSQLGAGGNATDFPGNAIVSRPYQQTAASTFNSCNFAQNADGVLDSNVDLMRFGLMTFDQDTDPGIGVNIGGSPQTVLSPAFTGMWSYFAGWNGQGASSPVMGRPITCNTPSFFEVGARNPAAPPWEGRMMMFPADEQDKTRQAQNTLIQSVLLASRPYGATPVAGMFDDAKYYFWKDPAGPTSDWRVTRSCRNEYIILLTDGIPNLDLRNGPCDSTIPNGCPYPLPEDTATALNATGNPVPPVKTYVVGFAVSSVQDQASQISCSTIVDPKNDTGCMGATAGTPLAACCQLEKIAVAGGTKHAYFADTPGELQAALAAILGDIARNSTTRTTPGMSPGVSSVVYDPNASSQPTSSALYYASLSPSAGLPWSGNVQRVRYACGQTGSQSQTFSTALGDDFATNLITNNPLRWFIAFQPDGVNGAGTAPDPTGVIRPFYSTPSGGGDGIAPYSATMYIDHASGVVPNITPSALKLQSGPKACQYLSNNGGGTLPMSDAQCASVYLSFTFATSSVLGTSPPSDFTFVHRDQRPLGDVYHSTPAVVGPPGALLRDDSYVAFRQTQWAGQSKAREQMVYVATNDGLLHAFFADEGQLENNERWALLPPAVMPQLPGSYPSTGKFLLDGAPIVKDVVWDRSFANFSSASAWRTTLVASFGPSQRGYYAVDVTRPTVTKQQTPKATEPSADGPVFLWQLVNMPATNFPIFASHSATPAITSLFMDPGDGKGAREIGVAILPGGSDGAPTAPAGQSSAGCARAASSPTSNDSAPLLNSSPIFQARGSVRCWGANGLPGDAVNGRALAVVRLDTGEILRVFMRGADAGQPSHFPSDTLAAQHRIIDTPLDSPLTGVPVVYPTDVGSDATKVFEADADGTVWKFDLSNVDPSKWSGQLFVDLYNKQVDSAGNSAGTSWNDGQPVVVPPVISVDQLGHVVLNVATGTQETYDANGLEYVYSVTEGVYPNDTKLRAQVNWWLGQPTFTPGERVSGPMAVFDGVLYFATYSAADQTKTCNGGAARLWARDFINPVPQHPEQGGVLRSLSGTTSSTQSLPVSYDVATIDPTAAGAVVPGVAIRVTTPCTQLGTGSSDQYVMGTTHQPPQGFSAPSFSLFAPVAAKASGSGLATAPPIDLALPTPVSPTSIDSWAAVVE